MFIYFIQEKILFHPVKIDENYEFKFKETFVEKFYKTPNNGLINSLRFTVQNPNGIVLYLHGNAGSLKDWALVYPQFTSRGYDVEIIDYRSYGKSKGKLSEENLYNDVQYIYSEILKDFPENNIIIHGRSIGTGMASKLCSENNPKSLILESPYYNIYDIAKKVLPIFPIKNMLKYKFESNVFLQKVKGPITILHGKKDQVIPFGSGLKLFNSVKEKTIFIEFEEGTHSNLASFKEYHKTLDEVLN